MNITTDLNGISTYHTTTYSAGVMGFLVALDGVAQDISDATITINLRKYDHSTIIHTDSCTIKNQTTDTGKCIFFLDEDVVIKLFADSGYGTYKFEVIAEINTLQITVKRGNIDVK